jgi:hypothetical protein
MAVYHSDPRRGSAFRWQFPSLFDFAQGRRGGRGISEESHQLTATCRSWAAP